MNTIDAETVGFRLSPQQQQLLAHDRASSVTQCAVLLDGPVDPGRLQQALDEVVGRHEILRTTFAQPEGMRIAQQIIGPDPARAWSLQQESKGASPIDDRAALERLMTREAERESDLTGDPSVRALLVGAGETQALLLLTVWAACADATSLPALIRELCDSYRDMGLAEDPIQYADYAEWRHELVADEESEAQEGQEYWRDDAAARPTPPQILFANGAGPSVTFSAAAPIDLREIGLEEVQRAAVGAGVSVAVLLEAAWHALLARLSGASELVLAGWCDGRAQPDLAGAIGPYEQPAPIHSRFQETTTFAEILDQVRRSRALAVRYQDCAAAEDLAALVKQTAAGWTFHAVGPLVSPAHKLLALRPRGGETQLTLALRAGVDELSGELLYDPLRREAGEARELAGRYVAFLRSALADPSLPIARLTILEEAEREHLVSASVAETGAGPAKPVHECFEEQARLTPDRLAVICASGSLTYADLDAASNRLANHLKRLAPLHRQTVGLCMERTPSMIVALMAILKAGGAYLPLNYEHPRARISHQLLDADARMLITEQHLLDTLGAHDATVVCVDRDAEAIAGCPADSLGSLVGPQDHVYVMYTSGSTGTPKGVTVTHGNLANYASSILARLSGEEDRDGLVFGVASAISTDLGNTSLFAPLVSGGCIRLIGAEASMDGDLFAEELGEDRLDVLKIAPSHLRALLAARRANVLPRDWLVLGGERLSWELVEEIRSLSASCRILNHYGPTETTVGCLTYPVDAEQRTDSLSVPIGFPLAGVRAYVLDSQLEPVPAGVPGELCIAGAGVAAGYLGASNENDGGFTADPFAPDSDAGRMYRTGDRVRLLRDGAIEFLGRLDDQVKIRGFRVQPGEIEATLLGHPALRAVAVCAEDAGNGDLRLIAYIVSPEPPTVEELRAFLGESLPDHMIPAAFRTAEALPLNAAGKIDRGALAGLAELQARREAEYVAPRDEVERQIAAIWSDLLGVERVGALDDFFALGGHSLLATQATMRIRRLYGEIPLRALLAAPTVAALAEVVRETGHAGADAQ